MTDTLSARLTRCRHFVRSPPETSSCPRLGYDRLPVMERRSWA